MRVDQSTLDDLEVIGAVGGAPGLLDHLDRTRTRAGREVLRRRITRPLRTAADIRAVQASLACVTSDRARFDALPTELQVSAVARYVDSRFATLGSTDGPAAPFEAAWIRIHHRDLYVEARQGIALLARFADRLAVMVDGAADAPGPLGGFLTELGNILYEEPFSQVSARRRFRTWTYTLRLDHAVREGGRVAVRRVIELVGEIDALVSMADIAAEKQYSTPEILEGGSVIEAEDIYHPFVEEPVPNSLRLSSDRLVFLTGPNMAGKTTLLKSCGVLALLAHAGMGVPAKRCRISRFDRLSSAIHTQDSLRDGVSYFQAEARRVRDLARPVAEGENCLIIADELFRGTNVKDARDASRLVLQAFARAGTGCYLVASHLVELADALAAESGVALRRLEAKLEAGAVTFPYRLEDGASEQRLGMAVLEREGVLALLDAISSRSIPHGTEETDE